MCPTEDGVTGREPRGRHSRTTPRVVPTLWALGQPFMAQVGTGALPLVGRALTQVQGGAWVRGAEPGQGQQHEACGEQQAQQVE